MVFENRHFVIISHSLKDQGRFSQSKIEDAGHTEALTL